MRFSEPLAETLENPDTKHPEGAQEQLRTMYVMRGFVSMACLALA